MLAMELTCQSNWSSFSNFEGSATGIAGKISLPIALNSVCCDPPALGAGVEDEDGVAEACGGGPCGPLVVDAGTPCCRLLLHALQKFHELVLLLLHHSDKGLVLLLQLLHHLNHHHSLWIHTRLKSCCLTSISSSGSIAGRHPVGICILECHWWWSHRWRRCHSKEATRHLPCLWNSSRKLSGV